MTYVSQLVRKILFSNPNPLIRDSDNYQNVQSSYLFLLANKSLNDYNHANPMNHSSNNVNYHARLNNKPLKTLSN